jgi:hypothetical protein
MVPGLAAMTVVAINGWNRVCIATRAQPQVKSAKAAAAQPIRFRPLAYCCERRT